MKYKQLLATIGAVAIIAGACGGTSPTTAPASAEPGATAAPATAAPSEGAGGGLAAEQILRAYVSDTDPETLTPYAAQDAVSLAVLGNIHRGLLHYDKDLNNVPAAAEALPEISPDGKTLTFKIRADAVYADGSPIVAADFVRAARQTLDPALANPYNYIICPIAGAEQLSACGGPVDGTDPAASAAALDALGVTAPDDKTVVFTLGMPATYFAAITAMWVLFPVKAEWIDPATGKFTEEAIIGAGSGPFVIKSWEHGTRITLVPNPNWYGEVKPTLTEVWIEIGGPLEQAFESYAQGDLDVVQVTSTAIIKQIDADPELSKGVHDTPQLGITYYDFANCNDPNKRTDGSEKCPPGGTPDGRSPTANKNFRIALTQAINKQEFIDVTFGGLGIVANSAVMPGIPGHDPDYNPYPWDPEAAKAAMAKAITELGITDTNADGAVDVLDLGTLSFGYNCNAGHLPRVTYLAEAWRKTLGFSESQFDIRCSDFPVFLKERPEGKYNIARDGWGADFPHPVNQLNDLFRCGAGNNNSQYCNPEFDQLMDQAGAEVDPVKAEELYKQAQRLLVDDAPVLWLRFAITRWMVQPYVSDVVITSSDHENPGDVFLETIKIMEH
jgi:oligopeptide transport system substrate-binding protein